MLLLTDITAENYLFVHEYGAVEIGDETALFYNDTVHCILSQPPTGDSKVFTELEIPCDCVEDCNTVMEVQHGGYVTIVKDGGERFSAKIDPRYCSLIYKAISEIRANEVVDLGIF